MIEHSLPWWIKTMRARHGWNCVHRVVVCPDDRYPEGTAWIVRCPVCGWESSTFRVAGEQEQDLARDRPPADQE